jgi:hypothetical protein
VAFVIGDQLSPGAFDIDALFVVSKRLFLDV